MANNQYVNKVVYGNDTLVDLTADTVTASALASGYTAHDASGAAIVGTMESGSMVIRDEEDSHGGTIRHITAGTVVQGTKSITSNGTHDVASYADAYVNVPAPAPNLQSVSKSYTPTETAQSENVTAGSGYDGLSQVSVSVGAIASDYVGSGVTRRSSSDLTASGDTVSVLAGYYASNASKAIAGGYAFTPATTITANPSIAISSDGLITASVSASKSVTPFVSAGYVSSGMAGNVSVSGSATEQLTVRNSSDLTASGATVTAPAGYYASAASKAIASGTQGAPTATKGTVSNHSVSVTPSVTNSAGYISGGTHSGTAVTVSASELVSGTKSITANGTNIDVTDYAAVDVSVSAQSGMSETDLKNYIQRSSDFTDIDWPDGLERIGGYAFYICGSFNPSSLPSTVTGIDGHAFYGCTSLALTSLPSGLTSVGAYAFYNCTSLALTSLPSGLTSAGVGNYAFSGCTSLALTSLPSGWTEIPTYAFRDCTSLALTSLPSGLTSVGAYAFYNCTSLALTSLPSGLTSVGTYAFSRCTGITTISYVGTTLTTLSASSFLGSSDYSMQLRSASFPNMALTSNISTVFGSTTAANACQFLEFCDIGSTVGIAANAFANCYALETLVLRKSTVCTLANVSAFLNTPMRGYNSKTGTVYVPSSLISSYQTATNWSTLYSAGTVTFSAIEGSDYELE